MVHAVLPETRDLYREALKAMHRDRKTVFVDRLGWDVPVVDGQYEIDQFDTVDAVYLLALDPVLREHLGSVRLLPTTEPHLLGEVFPELCEDGPPTGPDIWEITRLLSAPRLEREPARKVLGRLKTALVEFALLYGVRQYVCMAHLQWLSQLIAIGWDTEPLGEPREVGGEMVGALAINITPATLQMFRQRSGLKRPILHWTVPEAA
ncbi:acyl-homoserine-lactone synthase [Phenylobacterium sp.]|uniref:acyl-homoserine-lactone synthase n=1 Tax=Phenylobacterium sp. TaxID=1871053 RepID=UPI0035AE5223